MIFSLGFCYDGSVIKINYPFKLEVINRYIEDFNKFT